MKQHILIKWAFLGVFAVGFSIASQAALADIPRDPDLGREYYGIASWYGSGFQGQRTASGEKFNAKGLTAAHPTLPFGTLVEVSRRDRNKSVVVVITDRGPFTGRAIDLSRAAARRLHMTYLGTAPVKLQVIGMAE
ncbi:Rare lipoprotein A [Candidatus Terasakiella magnetica]|nr:Rare lipoprotein A [Candidatus Terasakiella magnetica]